MMRARESSMFRTSNDSFVLDNGVPCAMETPSSKRPNSESHPRAASCPSVSFSSGGKVRGRGVAE